MPEPHGPGGNGARLTLANGFLTADVNGAAAPGYSSGEAQAAVERIAAEVLPGGFSFEWTDLTYQEILAGNSAIIVFPLAVLLVFLVLAALYESLMLPLSIIMIVPMGLLAAMAGVWLSSGDSNIFTQIGLIVLVGLSAKNAILIVEFARELEFAGHTPRRAAIEASRLRLRPILMTSLITVVVLIPVAFFPRTGIDAYAPLATVVIAGLSLGTVLALFVVPVVHTYTDDLARLAQAGWGRLTGGRRAARDEEVPT